MNVAYCAGECGNCGNCLGCRPIPVENLLREFFHRLQVAHPSRMGMDQSSPLTSPITPPRGGVVTEWLKASLRDAFNRESQRRFTVFLGCGYAATCASAGGMAARRVGTPPVLFTTPDDRQGDLGHRRGLVGLVVILLLCSKRLGRSTETRAGSATGALKQGACSRSNQVRG